MVSDGQRARVLHDPARENMPQEEDDVALVEALRRGKTDAITILWRRHVQMVRGILRRMLGPDQDVEDLLQESFIQFHRHLSSLRDPKALRMFLIKITTNVVRAELRMRRVRRWVRPTDSGTLPEVAVRESDVEGRQALARFYQILEDLSAYERTAFVLRFVEDMDLADVADALGVSLATVKRHLSKVETRVLARVQDDKALAELLGRKGVVGAT